MLESLHIRNLVLVPEIELEFGAGLNAVTGETGAGKSLVIGALRLLAGGRAASTIIRKGAQNCEVSGTFRFQSSQVELLNWLKEFLEDNALNALEDNCLIIRRVISESGSRSFINGSQVTAAILKELGARLVDIHGPNDTQTLLHNIHQLELLDKYAGLQPELEACHEAWKELQDCRRQYDELTRETLAPEEMELLKYQLQEITDAAPRPDEEEELIARHKRLAHARSLIETASSVCHLLTEDESSAAAQLSAALRELRDIERIDSEKGSDFCSRLEELSENLGDLSNDLEDYADSLNIDEEALREAEDRLAVFQKLKRKYGPTLEDVCATAERISLRLARFASRQSDLEELQEREKACEKKLRQCCQVLTKGRTAAAAPLAAAITARLKDLGFNQALFEVQLKSTEPGPHGSDLTEFAFAPNPGEDIRPLKDTASSGEIARVMLAIKTVLSEVDSIPTLVFDEIDANVGGLVATAVARQLNDIGTRHQVFCITHLPVIAAAGRCHYLVRKNVVDGRTITEVLRLEGSDRTAEITRMMGAEVSSRTALEHAGELLKQFNSDDN